MEYNENGLKFPPKCFYFIDKDDMFYREVYNFEKFQEEAVRTFIANRAAMHPVTAGLVSKDLKVDAIITTNLWTQHQHALLYQLRSKSQINTSFTAANHLFSSSYFCDLFCLL